MEIEKGRSQYSVRNYDFYLGKFIEIMSVDKISQITPLLCRQYKLNLSRLLDRHGRPLKKATINYYLIALRSFLRYLLQQEDLKVMPPDKIELIKTDESPVKVLDDEGLAKMFKQPNLQKPNGLRVRAILEMLFSTGLRVAELIGLNKSEINFKSGEISVLGKGKRIRVVFVSQQSEWALKAYLAHRDDEYRPLFIRYRGKRCADPKGEDLRLTTRSVQKMVKFYAQKAGLALEPSPHTFRHTFATDLLRAGADLRSVQEMLGHKNVATTQRYTHVTNPQLRSIHQKFHPGNQPV